MPGLGTSFGRGGATDYQQDLANSDCIVIMGSNMAENHPVGFQWVMEAEERGAQVFHVDPRFTRTSAMATRFVGIRAGSDIAFLGGIVNYIFEHERWFDEYVKRYTNAPVIIDPEYADTEDLDGLFSGWNAEQRTYDKTSWRYEGTTVKAGKPPKGEQAGHGGGSTMIEAGEPPARRRDAPASALRLPDSQTALRALHTRVRRRRLRLHRRGVHRRRRGSLRQLRSERTPASFVYAVGWTQHTVGVQIIRTAAIIQLLLGNIGRPGGGIVALRGHASIQGSTDIPTLYNTLPGYIDMPHVEDETALAKWLDFHRAQGGWWNKLDAYLVSLLKSWWGAAATAENDFCFSYLPRIDDDNSHYWTVEQMLQGKVKGYIVVGQNPAVRLGERQGAAAPASQSSTGSSCATWSRSRRRPSGATAPRSSRVELVTEEIGTEVFFLPAASHLEKDGSFTNTQRLLQWHYEAVEPQDDCRSELWFYFHLGRKIRERLAESKLERDRPVQDLTWTYPTSKEIEEPSAEAVLAEINGWDAAGRPLSAYKQLEADGTTAAGCWIYCGVFADGHNQAARRTPHWEQGYAAQEWGWAWPANRRLLYNRASADPVGKPWSARKKLVWWDARQEKWTGLDTPDFDEQKSPSYRPDKDATGPEAIRGDHAFIMQSDGRGWLYVPQGLEDGPLPTHYEPHESPFRNPLYKQRSNPARQQYDGPESPPNEPGSDAYPYVVTTYRLTEHHTAGGMSRTVPHLAELQPEMFVEVHPDLARERGLEHGGWATISTARSAIEARVMVTDRMRPVQVDGRVRHQVGLPYHWGQRGLTTGDAANDLAHLALDPNVHIQEVKAFTCDIRPGRRR